jgi:hypothetical protein
VREPGKHGSLAGDGMRVAVGDVTTTVSVARVAEGPDAATSAVYDAATAPGAFFTSAAGADVLRIEDVNLYAVSAGSVMPGELPMSGSVSVT